MKTYVLADKESYTFNSILHSSKRHKHSDKGSIFAKVHALLTSEELETEDGNGPSGKSFPEWDY